MSCCDVNHTLNSHCIHQVLSLSRGHERHMRLSHQNIPEPYAPIIHTVRRLLQHSRETFVTTSEKIQKIHDTHVKRL